MGNTKTYTVVSAGGQDILVASHGDARSRGTFERSYECVACGEVFQESDIIAFRGKTYGVPCGCYKDIRSILRHEKGESAPLERRKEII